MFPLHLRSRMKRPQRRRSGSACVEAAACLPVLFLMVLGTVEVTSMIFLKQTLAATAYETCRAAIRTSGTTADARAAGNAILNSRLVKNASIVINPGSVETTARGDLVRVTVSAPANTNSVLEGRFVSVGNLSSTVVMVKE